MSKILPILLINMFLIVVILGTIHLAVSPKTAQRNYHPFINEKHIIKKMFGNMNPSLANWKNLDTVYFEEQEPTPDPDKDGLRGCKFRSQLEIKRYYNSINTILFEMNEIDRNNDSLYIFHFSASTFRDTNSKLHNGLLICCKMSGKNKLHGYYVFTKGRGSDIHVNKYDTIITNMDKTTLNKVFPDLGGHEIIKRGKIIFPHKNYVTYESGSLIYLGYLYYGGERFWNYFDFFRRASFEIL
jgi:uncharacterized protein YneF (UPF0154 family)